MKIQGGVYKGRKFKTLENQNLRPTLSKVRAAVFDVLQSHLPFSEAIFYDLFAGTGSVGLEALSRGFAGAVFVEPKAKIFHLLEQNTAFLPKVSFFLFQQEAFSFLEQSSAQNFNLPFSKNLGWVVSYIDPPYELYEQTEFCAKLQENLSKTQNHPRKYWVIQANKNQDHRVQTLFHPGLKAETIKIAQKKIYGQTLLYFLST